MTVKGSRVENRRSNCSLPWLVDWAFASSPQSGLAWSCFLFPLIEPDWQISRIRLSEKTHAFAHGRFAVRCGNWTKPYTECRDASGNRLYAGRGSLCLSHNHRRSLRRVRRTVPCSALLTYSSPCAFRFLVTSRALVRSHDLPE